MYRIHFTFMSAPKIYLKFQGVWRYGLQDNEKKWENEIKIGEKRGFCAYQ